MSRLTRASVVAMVSGLVTLGCGGGGAATSPSASSGKTESSASENSGEGNAAARDAAPAGPPKELDCGDFTTCAIASDGLVHCWGRDKTGELGDGPANKGERVKRGLVPGIGKVRKIALASQFGCALLEDKKVKCWGTGRLANDGRSISDAKPTLVSGVDDAEELVASGAIACARGPRGIVCWGADEKTIGTPPKGSFTQIATGFTHACAVDAAGAITCWGTGDWGGSGIYAKPAVTGAVQVATGDRHGCALMKDKTVRCWGLNDAGQLGIKSDMEPHKKPVVVPGVSGVAKIAVGEASTCALLADGSVRCWGSNGEGELGLGTRSPDERPARVAALSDVEQLCIASAHGCALTKQNKLLCWGSNAFGQIGDGTKDRRSSPTAVVW